MSAYGAVPGVLVRVAATAAVLAAAAPSQGVAVQDRGSRETAGQTVGPGDSAAVHPAPPRTLFLGFVETDGRTLPRGRGHVAVGYLGASILAQHEGFANVAPLVVQASYAATDNVTITAGSGFISYLGREDPVFIPYIAHKYRLWGDERSAIAFGHYLGVREPGTYNSERAVLFGASLAASSGVSDRLTINLGMGVVGLTEEHDLGRFTGFGRGGGSAGTNRFGLVRRTETDAVLAIGAEFALRPGASLVGEYRVVEPSEESGLLITGLRWLGTTLDGEVGLALWSGDPASFLPIASIGYRF